MTERVPVKSSNVAAIGYDHDNNTLHVEFKSGGVFRYAGVPPEAHAALMAAASIGGHFGQHIKPRYTHSKSEDTNA